MATKFNLLTKFVQFTLFFLILASCNIYKIHTVKVDTTEPTYSINNRKNPIILVHKSATDTMFKLTEVKIENSSLTGVLVPADSLVKSYYSQAKKYKKVSVPKSATPKCNQVHLFTQQVDLRDSNYVEISQENISKMETLDFDDTATGGRILLNLLGLGILSYLLVMLWLFASGYL